MKKVKDTAKETSASCSLFSLALPNKLRALTFSIFEHNAPNNFATDPISSSGAS